MSLQVFDEHLLSHHVTFLGSANLAETQNFSRGKNLLG